MEANENENEVFTALFERAQEIHESEWRRKYDKYVNQNMSEEDAKESADKKMMPKYITEVLERYTLLIQHIYDLRGGPVHQNVIKNVEKFMDRDMNEAMAIKVAVKKNRPLIESLLDTITPDDETEDEIQDESDDGSYSDDTEIVSDEEN